MSTSAPRVFFARQLDLLGVRDLLLNLVRAELTARYKTAAFGMLWFLLNPALMTAVLVVVFQEVVRLSIERYHVFLLAALLPWTFFQMGMSNAATSLTRSPGMVKRVRIPRALLPIATILASLVHFVLSMVLLLALLVFSGGAPHASAVLVLPTIMGIQLVCMLGAGVAAASLNVLYRDVEHLVMVFMRLGFWLTPIFYPFDYVPERLRPLALLNPMTSIIECYRAVLVRQELPQPDMLAIAAIQAVALCVVGAFLFIRLDPYMDDHV